LEGQRAKVLSATALRKQWQPASSEEHRDRRLGGDAQHAAPVGDPAPKPTNCRDRLLLGLWVCCNAKTITSVTAAARASNEVNHKVAPFSSNAASRNAVLTPAAAAVAPLLADSSFNRWSWRLAHGRWPPTPARRCARSSPATSSSGRCRSSGGDVTTAHYPSAPRPAALMAPGAVVCFTPPGEAPGTHELGPSRSCHALGSRYADSRSGRSPTFEGRSCPRSSSLLGGWSTAAPAPGIAP